MAAFVLSACGSEESACASDGCMFGDLASIALTPALPVGEGYRLVASATGQTLACDVAVEGARCEQGRLSATAAGVQVFAVVERVTVRLMQHEQPVAEREFTLDYESYSDCGGTCLIARDEWAWSEP